MAVSFSEIPFSRWAEKYSEYLKTKEGIEVPLEPHQIPLYTNPYGLVRYKGLEIFTKTKIKTFACIDGEERSWICTMNISDTCVYVRGLYCDPNVRNKGYGKAILEYGLSQWTSPFDMVALYTYGDIYRFYERCGFTIRMERTLIYSQNNKIRSFNIRNYLMTKNLNGTHT